MKKTTLLALCLFGTALTINAQFKIHSNGNMSFKRIYSSQPLSPISLSEGGSASDSLFFVSYRGESNGIHFYTDNPYGISGRCYGGFFRCYGGENTIHIGMKGSSMSDYTTLTYNPTSVGVWGDGTSYGSSNYSYGVLGTIYGGSKSAAVCGIEYNTSLTSFIPDDHYAGLFVGKTKVVGTLTATGGLYNTTLYNCPIVSGRNETTPIANDGMTTSLFQGLTTVAYHNSQEVSDSRPRPTFLDPDSITIAEMEKRGIDVSRLNEKDEDVIYRQIQEKQHYALSADELERVFPNLVYTDKDGGKAINYVEMVPLLVQCINELNARLTALDGNVGAGVGGDLQSQLPARSETAAIDGTPATTRAVLYQNTPNPFTAQTEIRFSLPDDAPASYIYIFDMNGRMQKQIPVDATKNSVTINGYELSAGIYLYSLVVGGQEIDTKRMILSK